MTVKNLLSTCLPFSAHLRRHLPEAGLCMALLVCMPVVCTAEDLSFHYALALQNDPKLRAAEANRNAVSEKVSQARAGFLPTLGASANLNKNNETVVTDAFTFSQPAGQATFHSREYRLNLSQPIFRAEVFAAFQVASADARQAEAQTVAARQDLILRVSQAYFEALLAQDALSYASAEKEAMAHQRESAKGRLQAGLAPITDVHDAEAALQTARSHEIDAQNQLADKREALAETTGQRPGTLATLIENLPTVTPEPPDIDAWARTARQQNPAIQAAKAAVDSAHEVIAQNRAGHYPTLDLVGSNTKDDANGSITGPGVRTDNRVIGLQLNVPIFQGGLINARTREAAYRYEAARQDMEAKQRNVERTTRASYQNVNGGIAKIGAFTQSVAAATESLAAKTQGYRAGLYTTLDVLNATRDLYRAKRDLAEARYGYGVSLLQLKQAAGTLNDEDLQIVNGWLRP